MAQVSVIMPAYNVAPYIGAAVASVQAQTLPDWELLIVDDGSTDETPGVLDRLAREDTRVRVLRKDNGGISAARNAALRAATAEFIALLDGDDLWEPGFLSEQLAILENDPATDIVTGNAWFLGSRYHGLPARPCPDTRPEPTLRTILADETAVFIMTVLRRRVYETIGGFNEALRTNEDYEFWLRAAAADMRFTRNDRPLAHYRRRDDSLSASEVRMLRGVLTVYESIRPLLTEHPEELRILERQVARFERESLAAEARLALTSGDTAIAADHLSRLYARGGGAMIGLASVMARWTPGLLARAYQLRRARQGARS